MPAASPSLRWLYLAVLGPLVVLAFIAWWGTQSQLKAAWADARDEAEHLAPQLADELSSKIQTSYHSIPDYPDPPRPGPPNPREKILSSDKLADLIILRDDPDAGNSASGLPLRVLAALRIETLSPGSQPRQSLLDLLIREAPSSITATALRKLRFPNDYLSEWVPDESRRYNARRLPLGQLGVASGGIQEFHDTHIMGMELIRRTEEHIEYFTSAQSWEFLETARRTMKSGLFVTTASPSIHWPGEVYAYGKPMLASAPLDLDCPLTLEVRVIPELLEAPIRRQQHWTFALLAAALLTATISLIVIHRTVVRERRLADLKSQFVASVSHELRAPLGSIRLMAEALQQEKVSKPAEFHSLIAREGARLSHLIENVLDFARIEEGRKRYRFEECDLTALLRDTLRLMQPIANDRGVHLTFELPELTATVDPTAIQQALVNLLDNAIKFTPPKSTVNLQIATLPDQSIQISITDHGAGIPKSEHRNIFKRFHRLGNELRRETQGSGIGLSIVKHIAEAHDGSINVSSTPPDGATFTLTLPDRAVA
ncbi:sensor histidine kinase [Haloferula sp.]|uniref:sensor histidine kinase n=1 Tax=Haloferula sp. TaxID=2497595 RepID=UPI00329EAC11